MSRTITISTDVFAAIWAKRQDGEEAEDAILRRILDCDQSPKIKYFQESPTGTGVHDTRNDVFFPEGFEIFRTYKRREYRAIASNGMWHRIDTDGRFSTLNQLNESIAAGPENVWNGNWKFRAPNGSNKSINELRP